MTPVEHNKYLGMAHLAYGVLHILLLLVAGVFMIRIISLINRDFERMSGDGSQQMGFFAVIMVFAVAINVAFSIPPFVAGYAFLKRKRWAKIAGIIAAVVSAMSFPLGTALCVYTFWFLFSEPGKVVYDGHQPTVVSPPPPPANWGPPGETPTPDWR